MHDANLILRAARREEADRLLAFYEKNPDRFLLPRPFEEFAASIARGQFFVVVEGEEIQAASGVFDYAKDLPFVELAETYVSPSLRGVGLQGIFFRLRIASVIVYQGPSIGITTAVDGQNEFSLKTTSAQGFEKWSAPIAEAYLSCHSCPNKTEGRVCCCDFYVLPVIKAREAVARILAETESGSLSLENKRGVTRRLDCACSILAGEHREALAEFASGKTW